MTTPPTDDQSLKLFLAGRLKEKMGIVTDLEDNPIYAHWRGNKDYIKDTEWDCIARLVEQTLTRDQFEKYHSHLENSSGAEIDYYEWRRHMVMAPWQDRAKALKKVTA